MKRVILPLFVAGFAVLGAAASASTPTENPPLSFEAFKAKADAKFIGTDINSDGFITIDERKAARAAKHQAMMDKKFAFQDVNGDGVISKSEVQQRSDERLARRAEIMASVKERRADQESEPGAAKKSKGKRVKRSARVASEQNGDGFISRAEFDASVVTRFAKLDKNGDGVLEGRELRKSGKRRGKGRK